MNPIESSDLLERLRTEAGANWPEGQILLCHNERSTSFKRFIKLENYQVAYVPHRNSSSEIVQLPELQILYKELKTIDEEGVFTWKEDSKIDSYTQLVKRGWALWSGNYAARMKLAINMLDGGVTADMQEELAGLLANEEADNNNQTGILAKGSKAYLQTMLSATEERKNELNILTTLMQREAARRMSELSKVMAQANAIVQALSKKVERIQRIITVIELYMGVDEELHQLRSGESAAHSEPISFRQRCLFMDEEIAVKVGFAKAKEFDFQTIEVFDDWVLQGDNLDYLLPEKRGIVVLRPRRKAKDYQVDYWLNSMLNKENLAFTYFLIRDGANLYRIFTEKLVVLDRLFPKRDELAQMFARHQSAHFTSDKEKLEDDMYQYRKRATFLQGLLDRTTVFGQLGNRINLFALTEQSEKLIRFIYDDDDNQLSDGRPPFKQWLAQKNSTIQAGSRILITGYYRGYGQPKDFKERLFYYCNDHRVPPLPKQGLYLVEKPVSELQWSYYDPTIKDLCIKYNPGDEVGTAGWGVYDPHERIKRVSWAIKKTDSFLLHYDIITAEECRYYLFNRSNRTQYTDMLPILETLMLLKEEEANQEAPFIQLVADECMRRRILATHQDIEDLVTWWKTKNKWKRAITLDDTKALRMIINKLKTNT